MTDHTEERNDQEVRQLIQDASTRWDHATLDEVLRRRNAFVASWHEVIATMRAETVDAPTAVGTNELDSNPTGSTVGTEGDRQ